MKSRKELLRELEHHKGLSNLYKFPCIISAVCFFSLLLQHNKTLAIFAILNVAIWGVLWNGEVMYMQRIKEEIDNS